MSKIVVLKFGGTSVGSIDRIKKAAEIVRQEVIAGYKPIVVVSAMSGVTNDLMAKCLKMSPASSDSLVEFDAALSSGEQVSAALLALGLCSIDVKARSLQGWQLPIMTDKGHFGAKVIDVDVEQVLTSEYVPVISGFQGVSADGRITTLGKGGSDITACLLAAKLKADRCEIYTDVEGIYSADPRVVSDARRFESIDRKMLYWLSASGAKVMHQRAVLCAVKYDLDLIVRSSFELDKCGTKVTLIENNMEQSQVLAVTSNQNIIKLWLTISSIELNGLLQSMASKDIFYEKYAIRQGDGNTQVEFILPLHYHDALRDCLQSKWVYQLDNHVATISLIGYHLRDDAELLASISAICKRVGANIMMISREDMKIEIMVDEKFNQQLVRLLHDNLVVHRDKA